MKPEVTHHVASKIHEQSEETRRYFGQLELTGMLRQENVCISVSLEDRQEV